MPRILTIQFELPEPTFGGRMRLFCLIKELRKAGHAVDALAYLLPGDESRTQALEDLGVRLIPVSHAPVHSGTPNHSRPMTLRNRLFGQGRLRRKLQALRGWFEEAKNLLNPVPRSARFRWLKVLRSGLQQVQLKDYDLILVEHLETVRLLHDLDHGTPVILTAHNVLSHYFLRRARSFWPAPVPWAAFNALLESFKWRYWERRALGLVDSLVVMSEQDRERVGWRLSAQQLAKITVIENGVDSCSFHPSTASQINPKNIVFTGLLGYEPNWRGILWFLDFIFPLVTEVEPEVELTIVGAQPPSILQERVTSETRVRLTGWVEDTRPYLERAALVVIPLHLGGGTRLKFLEAAAMGKAIVSTSIGAEGLKGFTPGVHYLEQDEPTKFARDVIRLLDQPRQARALGEAASLVARENYDWSVLGKKLNSLIYQTLEARRVPT